MNVHCSEPFANSFFHKRIQSKSSEAISSVALLPHPFNMDVVFLQPEPCSLHLFFFSQRPVLRTPPSARAPFSALSLFIGQSSLLCIQSSSAMTLSPASFYFSQDSVSCISLQLELLRGLRSHSSCASFFSFIPAYFFSFIALLHHADSSSLIHGSSLDQSSSSSSYSFGVLSLQLLAFTSSSHHTFTPSSLQHIWRQSLSDQPSLAPVFLVFFFLSHHGYVFLSSLSFFIHIRFFSVSHFDDRLVPLFFIFIFIFSQVSSLSGIISTASYASVHCGAPHLVSYHLISSSSHLISLLSSQTEMYRGLRLHSILAHCRFSNHVSSCLSPPSSPTDASYFIRLPQHLSLSYQVSSSSL